MDQPERCQHLNTLLMAVIHLLRQVDEASVVANKDIRLD